MALLASSHSPKDVHVKLIGNSTLPVGVTVDGCLSCYVSMG